MENIITVECGWLCLFHTAFLEVHLASWGMSEILEKYCVSIKVVVRYLVILEYSSQIMFILGDTNIVLSLLNYILWFLEYCTIIWICWSYNFA